MELEEEMDLNISDDAAERIQNPSDLLRFLREQLGLRDDDSPA
jgi:acyl carrier protein